MVTGDGSVKEGPVDGTPCGEFGGVTPVGEVGVAVGFVEGVWTVGKAEAESGDGGFTMG